MGDHPSEKHEPKPVSVPESSPVSSKDPLKNESKEEQLIDLNDFQSIKVNFQRLENVTSGTQIGVSNLKLLELEENGLTLEMPPRKCAFGHILLLELDLYCPRRKKMISLSSTFQVEELETIDNREERVRLTTVNCIENSWRNFLKFYSDRQEEIMNFLNSTRG